MHNVLVKHVCMYIHVCTHMCVCVSVCDFQLIKIKYYFQQYIVRSSTDPLPFHQ